MRAAAGTIALLLVNAIVWPMLLIVPHTAAESVAAPRRSYMMLAPDDGNTRSNADGTSAAHMYHGDFLHFQFTCNEPSVYDFSELRYSNDGDADTLVLTVDDSSVATYRTRAQFGHGHLWNHFILAEAENTTTQSSRQRSKVELGKGLHDARLDVLTADQYGVEIDYIRALRVSGSCSSAVHISSGTMFLAVVLGVVLFVTCLVLYIVSSRRAGAAGGVSPTGVRARGRRGFRELDDFDTSASRDSAY